MNSGQPLPTEAERFAPPSPALLRLAFALPRVWFSPVFLGLEQLDLQKPALWVGNHTLYGILDLAVMVDYLFEQQGIALRGLGDRAHLAVPVWSELLRRCGMVLGTPENCAALMRSGAHVLVFPGGAREVFRRKGEAYELIWKQRTGFARLAIEQGYDIIPFASLGVAESLDILIDANDVMTSPLWNWLDHWLPLEKWSRNGDAIPPLVRGLGPTALPRPQRLYFSFGQRISTAALAGSGDNAATVWQLRQQVADGIRQQQEILNAYRQMDKPAHWSRLRRWLAD